MGICCIVLLSEVLDMLAKLNTFMQKKTADFSTLPSFLESILEEIKSLKREDSKWCSDARIWSRSTISALLQGLESPGELYQLNLMVSISTRKNLPVCPD